MGGEESGFYHYSLILEVIYILKGT